MKYALNLAEDGRILSATYPKYAPKNAVLVDELPWKNIDELPRKNIADYIYQNGEYIYNPLPVPEQPEVQPTTDDILNAMLGVTV